MYKFVGSFSLVGFFIPTVLLALIYYVPTIRMFFHEELVAEFFLLSLSPSSFLLMGSDSYSILGPLFVAGINTFLYTGVGYLFWLGKHKYRWILYATGLLIISFWSWLYYSKIGKYYLNL